MKKAFTLIEMLVVMGIIAVLIGASLASFSKMSKSADKTKAQELVSQAATALAAIYAADGTWPKAIREANADEKKGRLNSKIALILAKRRYMSLSLNAGETKLVGKDRFGVLTPSAAKMLERNADVTEGTVEDSILQFAVDLNGDGVIRSEECGKRTGVDVIRATAVVWGGGAQSWTKDQAGEVK